MILKVLAFVLMIVGAIIVFSAGWIVKRFNPEKDIKLNSERSMDEDEEEKLKYTKAIVKIKMIGMLVMLPGLILVIFAFK